MHTDTAKKIILKMNNPMQWMDGTVFSYQINFYNNDGYEDETSFDVDCRQFDWRDELLELWDEFRKENNLPEECFIDVWVTTIDEG